MLNIESKENSLSDPPGRSEKLFALANLFSGFTQPAR